VVHAVRPGRGVRRTARRAGGRADLVGLDVQAAGAVAAIVAGRRGVARLIATASPARPRLETLFEMREAEAIQVAGGKLVFVTDRGFGAMPLRGTTPANVVDWRADQQPATRTFDFDGRRLAYASADAGPGQDVLETTPGRIHLVDVP